MCSASRSPPESKEDSIRECSVITLGAIGRDAKETLPRLKELAEKDVSPNVRKSATTAIKNIES